jgi:hypothetical protein
MTHIQFLYFLKLLLVLTCQSVYVCIGASQLSTNNTQHNYLTFVIQIQPILYMYKMNEIENVTSQLQVKEDRQHSC